MGCGQGCGQRPQVRLVWAIKDYLCLQGPDMFMALTCSGPAMQAGLQQSTGWWETSVLFIGLTQGVCHQTLVQPTHNLWALAFGSPRTLTCLLPPPLLVLQDSVLRGRCHRECSWRFSEQ